MSNEIQDAINKLLEQGDWKAVQELLAKQLTTIKQVKLQFKVGDTNFNDLEEALREAKVQVDKTEEQSKAKEVQTTIQSMKELLQESKVDVTSLEAILAVLAHAGFRQTKEPTPTRNFSITEGAPWEAWAGPYNTEKEARSIPGRTSKSKILINTIGKSTVIATWSTTDIEWRTKYTE